VSANVMGALVGGLDRARGVPHRRWLRGKLVAAALALGTSVLVVATTLALIGGSRMVDALAQQIFGKGAPNVTGDLLYLIGTGSLLIFTVVTFHIGPNAPRRRFIADVPGAGDLGDALARRVAAVRDVHRELRLVQDVYGGWPAPRSTWSFLFLTCVSLLIGAEVNEQMARMRAEARRVAAERAAAAAPPATGGAGAHRHAGAGRPAHRRVEEARLRRARGGDT